MWRVRSLIFMLCALTLSACQTPRVYSPQSLRESSMPISLSGHALHLEGRLIIEIESKPAKRISAAFELDADPLNGELRLLGPLGTTSALISWTEHQAQLQSTELSPPTRLYANLSNLTQQWLGADLPLQSILRWLNGQDEEVMGWQFQTRDKNTKIAQRAHTPSGEPFVRIQMILNETSP
jgi:outer membrane biogenesis lipoprotein LolB